MRLFRYLKASRVQDRATAGGPLRSLAMVGSLGLMAGWGAFAVGAVPAIVAQDQDPEENVRIEVKNVQSEDGEDVEVIVVGEVGVDHEALLKKLKSEHGIDIMNLRGDEGENVEIELIVEGEEEAKHQGVRKKVRVAKNVEIKELRDENGNVEVFVVDGDGARVKSNNQVRGGVAKFLLKQGAGKANHHELANQLRAIADQLDGKAHGDHPNVKIRKNIELHHDGAHGIHIHKQGVLDKKNHQKVEVITSGDRKLHVLRSDKPHEMIVDLTAEGDHKLLSAHGAHGRLLLKHGKEHGKAVHDIIVKKLHGEVREAHKQSDHGDHGQTSDESEVSTLEDLRAELEALRNDLKSLRAKRQPQKKKRVQLKNSQSSSSDASGNRFVWFSDDENSKPENTFVWKLKDGTTKKMSPNRFRFEFESDEESDDRDQ